MTKAAISSAMAEARARGDAEEFGLQIGQTAGLIDDVVPAGELVKRIAAEAEAIIRGRLADSVAE